MVKTKKMYSVFVGVISFAIDLLRIFLGLTFPWMRHVYVFDLLVQGLFSYVRYEHGRTWFEAWLPFFFHLYIILFLMWLLFGYKRS